jgi:hypothetical protein
MKLLNKYDKKDGEIVVRFNEGYTMFLINYNTINFVLESQTARILNKLYENSIYCDI